MKILAALLAPAFLLPLSGCSWLGKKDVATDSEQVLGPNVVLQGPPESLPPAPLLSALPDTRLQAAESAELSRCSKAILLPPEIPALAHKTNFGDRYRSDAWGRPLDHAPALIVIHETVIDQDATIALFRTPHERDEDQSSYHVLIGSDGSRIRIVPDEFRAYGAGMSAFGDFTQKVKPRSPGSINNIALHISLVTPSDGRDDRGSHSGYTDSQYRALAAQVLLWQASYGIPMTRVTTHAAVDRSHSRYDPRSFYWDKFDRYYTAFAQVCSFGAYHNKSAGL